MSKSSTGQGEAKHIVSLLIAKAIRAPLWLLLSAVLARFLEPSGLGVWSMILAVAALMNQVLLHWTQAITQRFGRKELLETQTLTQTFSSRLPFLVIGWFLASILLFYQPFLWLNQFYGLQNQHVLMLCAVLCSLWFMAEAQSLQQVSAKFGRVAWLPISADFLLLLVLACCLTLGLHDWHLDNKLRLIAIFLMLFWAISIIFELGSAKFNTQIVSIEVYKQRFLFASPLILGFIVGYFSEWCDYFLIRYYYSEYEVGLFHSAYQYMLLLVGLPTAIVTVMLPRLTVDNNSESNLILLNKKFPLLCFFWLFASFFIMVIIPPVFNILLGEKFLLSRQPLLILLSVVPSAIIIHLYGMLCFLQGRLFFSTVVIYSLKIIINIMLSLWLLPRYGIEGSAISIVISYFCLQWLLVLDQYRLSKPSSKTPLYLLLLMQIYGFLMMLLTDSLDRLLLSILFAMVTMLYLRHLALIAQQDILLLPLNNYPKVQVFLCNLLLGRGK